MSYTPKPPFHFFYNGVFSNWCMTTPFTWRGHHFSSGEHAMMWAKATLFEDHDAAEDCLNAATPRIAKAIGRRVRRFDPKHWNRYRMSIVTQVCEQRLRTHKFLYDEFQSLKGKSFVEASSDDRIWGIGLGMDDDRIHDPSQWQGENRLGQCYDRARVLLEENPPVF